VVHAKPPRKVQKAALKAKLTTTRKKIRDTRAKLHDAKRSEHTIAEELSQVKARLDATRARLSAAKERLARTRREQARVAALLLESQKRLKAREESLARRMAANYRQGPVRYASVVLGSRNMGEMVSRAYVVRTVMRYDAQLIAQIKADRADVLKWKAQADAKTAQVAKQTQDLAVRQAEESQETVNQRALLAEARERRAEWENALQSLEDDSEAVAARLRALEATAFGQARRLIAFTGNFVRPVSGPIISSFGPRYHPILHYTRLHAGVDFAAGHGSPIYSAGDGVVVFAGQMRGYGNVLIVDHGSGVSTLYAHCSALLVGDGVNVAKGQNIARVGATGLATGPHLHFEVRKNGSPVNPVGAL
jgi:murein DD-endopeptidase MepM/ murein hydrolase activator NlpD